jgi:hypothetical protein
MYLKGDGLFALLFTVLPCLELISKGTMLFFLLDLHSHESHISREQAVQLSFDQFLIFTHTVHIFWMDTTGPGSSVRLFCLHIQFKNWVLGVITVCSKNDCSGLLLLIYFL